jgi:phage-related minor tail protein
LAIVDEFGVAIVADDSQLDATVKQAFRGSASTFTGAGRDSGKNFTQGFKAGADVESPLRDARGRFTGQARDVGRDSGEGFGTGFADAAAASNRKVLGGMRSLGGRAAVAFGAAFAAAGIGALIVGGITESMDLQAANAKLQVQLGATTEQASRYGKIAGDLYRNNFGGSVQDVNEGLRATLQSGILAPGAADSALQDITGKVLNLRDVFGTDLTGAVRAAGQLVRTGLARDSDQALDIITRGFQTGADASTDFLDTLTEYSTQFRKFGLTGGNAIGLLSQGMQAGARDADVVADAIKEFSIRAVDGSTLTAQGFEALGLSAKTMGEQIGRGGQSATDALDVTLDKLRGIKDPVEQSQAAVALFGTQAEDLGAALFALDPSRAEEALGRVEGAADKMGQTLGQTASSNLESFKRQVSSTFVEAVGGYMLPALTKGTTFLATQFGPALDETKAKVRAALVPEGGIGEGPLGPLIAGAKSLGAQVGPALQAAGGTLLEFGAALLPTLQSIGTEIIGVVGPALGDIGEIISTQVVPAFQAFLPAVTPVAKFLLTVIGGAVVAALKGAVNVIRGVLTIAAGVINVFAAIFTGDWSRLWSGLGQILSGAFKVILGMIQLFLSVGFGKLFKLGFTGLQKLFGVGTKAIGRIWQAGLDALAGLARGILNRILGIITGYLRAYVGAWRFGLSGLRSVAASALGAVVGLFRGLLGRIAGTLRGAGTALYGIGQRIVEGLIQGIKSLGGRIGDTLVGLLPGPLRKFAGALKITSPSRVFRDYGVNIGEGLVLGIDASRAPVTAATQRLAAAATPASPTLVRADLAQLATMATAQARATLVPTAGQAPTAAAGRNVTYQIDARGMDRNELIAAQRQKEQLDELLYGQVV